MKELLKQLGLIIMLIGIGIVLFVMAKGENNNTALLWSLIIIVVGLITYIVINHYVEE